MSNQSKTLNAGQSPSLTLPRDERGRGNECNASEAERDNSLSQRMLGEGWGEGLSHTIPVPHQRSTQRSRELRKNQTEAETVFWHAVKAKRFYGQKFRRQFPIGPYFADFACIEQKLVVEIDGGQHCENKADEVRSTFIEAKGFTVLRFWNNDVLENIDGVLETLKSRLGASHGPQ